MTEAKQMATIDPAADVLRSNVGTWAVPAVQIPAVAHFMHDVLPNEPWDPHFLGQELRTCYFDTQHLVLRRARRKGEQYLTLRLRCYRPLEGGPEFYALSGKTEAEKWRQEIDDQAADALLANPAGLVSFLPPNLLARDQGLVGDQPLLVAVCVCCRRYAVEDDTDRYTLDVDVHTDTGKCLPFAALEYKSSDLDATAPGSLLGIGLRPIKLSKFLWATDWR